MQTIRRLGTGTSSRVTLCRVTAASSLSSSCSVGSLVAVKSVSLKRLADPKFQDRFIAEATILKNLSHPNIVSFLDITWNRNVVSLVLEFCDMGTLKAFLAKWPGGRLKEVEGRFFFRQLANGMQYIRSQGLVHRDLKTENLLLMGDPSFKTLPVLKIADFGLSREDSESFSEKIGTLQYMAPEVLINHEYDARCDLWSMGIVYYEILVGTPPYITSKTADELISNICASSPTSLSLPQEISGTVSASANKLVSELLTRNPIVRIPFEVLWESTYLDLDHIPSSQSIRKAHTFLDQAITLDQSIGPLSSPGINNTRQLLERLENVINLYMEAIEHLLSHLQFVVNRESSEAVKSKHQISLCLERVEKRKIEAVSIRTDVGNNGPTHWKAFGWYGSRKQPIDPPDAAESWFKHQLPFENISPYYYRRIN